MSYIGSPPVTDDPELLILSGVTPQQATDLSGVSTFVGPILASPDMASILALSDDAARIALGTGTTTGSVLFFARNTAPAGFLKANGAAVLVASYPTLTTAIYCGDANNATALFGYRCDLSDGTSRNITGIYLVLPDMRGEFPRGWDDARGVDAGRAFGTFQTQSYLSHSHGTYGSESGYSHPVRSGADSYIDWGSASASTNDANYNVNSRTDAAGGTETRPRNISLLACIKY